MHVYMAKDSGFKRSNPGSYSGFQYSEYKHIQDFAVVYMAKPSRVFVNIRNKKKLLAACDTLSVAGVCLLLLLMSHIEIVHRC